MPLENLLAQYTDEQGNLEGEERGVYWWDGHGVGVAT